MKGFLQQLGQNHILWVTIIAWVLTQSIKVALGVIREKRFDFRWFVGPGGIPSSHAAGASALATSIGIRYGFNTVSFALAAAFTIVVMFDAQNVRRAAGKQAQILNKMMEDIYWRGKIKETQLRELLGHTPVEVFLGMILGILIAIILS
ncbi:MAG: divergent PAP2 family protein [Candidatus Omnitrophota bacterium]|jgi:acid phosphatase family membrane protein YuiD